MFLLEIVSDEPLVLPTPTGPRRNFGEFLDKLEILEGYFSAIDATDCVDEHITLGEQFRKDLGLPSRADICFGQLGFKPTGETPLERWIAELPPGPWMKGRVLRGPWGVDRN